MKNISPLTTLSLWYVSNLLYVESVSGQVTVQFQLHIALPLTLSSYAARQPYAHVCTKRHTQTNIAAPLRSTLTDGNHYLILNSKGNHFISQKANYQSSKYLGNEMNWDLLLDTDFLHGNPNLGFKQVRIRKINVPQWEDGPAVDLCDTTGETAGVIMEVSSLIWEWRTAQDAMCQTRTWGLKEEEVSPLWHFAV